MSTKTLVQLRNAMQDKIGDNVRSTVTTALTTDVAVVDTTLENVEGGSVTDYFLGKYLHVTSEANIGVIKLSEGYNATSFTNTVTGANFASDTAALATYELTAYSPTAYKNALNDAARDLYPSVFKRVLDTTLITGNIIPNAHFEHWTDSSTLKIWYSSNATLSKGETLGTHPFRGGLTSVKTAVTAGNGSIRLDTDFWVKLTDLSGETVSLYVWVWPEVTDDVSMIMKTEQADGTAQTWTSTTSAPALRWTRLELENKTLNSDLEFFRITLQVVTNAKYAYWDNAWLVLSHNYDLIVPDSLQGGVIKKVHYQTSGVADDYADDISPLTLRPVFGWQVIHENGYDYLRLPGGIPEGRLLQLEGYAPLENDLSSDTDTITIDEPYTELLEAKAILNLYRSVRGVPTSESADSYTREYFFWDGEVARLSQRLKMHSISGQINWR